MGCHQLVLSAASMLDWLKPDFDCSPSVLWMRSSICMEKPQCVGIVVFPTS